MQNCEIEKSKRKEKNGISGISEFEKEQKAKKIINNRSRNGQ